MSLTVLATTGVWLWFRYLPSASSAWPGTRAPAHDESWIRTAHRVVAYLVVVLAVVALVLAIGRRVRSGVRGVVAGTGVLVTALAASFTGYLLPWDQLALWAVSVGSDIRGVQAPFRAEVKYIIVGSHEVSPSTYRFWAVSHVVLGVLVAATVVLVWLRSRARDVSRRPLSPPPAAPPPGLEPQPVG
ncbi:MAG TPA: cytochrome b N-terminal domain-containing protein [Acidimicrobiia bacterium]